jgi:hypothetical protein
MRMQRIATLTVLLLAVGTANADDDTEAPPAEETPTEETPTEEPPVEAPAPEPVVEKKPPPPKTPFDRGKMSLSAAGGSTSNFGERYFVIGAGFGYFVLDGVELGISAVHQFGDGPSISKVVPSLRYVAQPLVGKWPLIPYAGVFYTHWFIGDEFADVDAVGARAGLLYVSGRVLLGLGIAVERTVSTCDPDVDECVTFYPDFTLSLSL